MAYRVLLTDPLGPEGLARLREQPELEIEARPGLPPPGLCEASTRSSSGAARR